MPISTETIKVVFRRNQNQSGNIRIIMKHQEGLRNARPGMKTSLGWEGRLFRESILGRETRMSRETSNGFKALWL